LLFGAVYTVLAKTREYGIFVFLPVRNFPSVSLLFDVFPFAFVARYMRRYIYLYLVT
jgi:hypothetical protein